ncbi:MAG: right-handed parallel beta-helix repeat-containing protein [Lentisphaeria bacterium]|jgi:hypothetical protein|nr:right-handed parallel beta-helix repeat-containing protein [Lentisphaeria bacterium]
MTRRSSALLIAALAFLAMPGASAMTTLHLSPQGDDAGTGTPEQPFRTLARARDEIRRLKTAGGLPEGGVTVLLLPGVYPLPSPLELTGEDAGTAASPIVYRAAERGTAILSGGGALAGWQPVADPAVLERLDERARGQVVHLDLPPKLLAELPGFANGGCGYRGKPQYPLALFQNETRLPVSRWPNEGYAKMGQCLGESRQAGHVGTTYTQGIFRFADPRLARWAGEPDLWFDGLWFHSWADQKMALARIDLAERTITLLDPQSHSFGFKAGQGFYAFNAISEIDRPGEWAVDRAARRLYLWPLADPAAAPVTLAAGTSLVMGDSSDYTTFEGLVFAACRERALVFRNSTAVTVAACTMRQTGSTAVDIDGGSRCTVIGCDMYDLGEGGARATGGDYKTLTPGGHRIENNHIHHFGRIVGTYRPAAAVYGVGNAIRHNLVYQAQHQALYFHGNDHLVEYNIVHDVCQHTNDAGAIYAVHYDWSERGSVIRHNFVHSLGAPVGGQNSTNGIYMDDQSCGITIESNILSLCEGSGIVVSCRDHVIANNIAINCRTGFNLSTRGIDSFCRPSVALGRESFQFKKLLGSLELFQSELWRTRYPNLLAPLDQDPILAHSAHGNTLRANVAVGSGELRVADRKTIETTCVITDNVDFDEDPGFVDYANFDLRLRPDAPVFQKLPGFQAPDFARMGLYDDPLRASPAVKFGPGLTPMPPIMSPAERAQGKLPLLWPIPATGDAPVALLAWDRDRNEVNPPSQATLATTGDSLLVAIQNPVPATTSGHQWGRDDGVEVALAPARDADLAAAPTTTILRGYPDGHFACATDGGLTDDQARRVASFVEFTVKPQDGGGWSAAWRIPFAALDLDPRQTNWPILAHLSAHRAAAQQTLGWRRRWTRETWEVTGGYALCLDAFGPVPFAPGYPPPVARIDVQGDRNAASLSMEPGPGAEAPDWAKKWNRLVAAFGVVPCDRWQPCQFEFTPQADATVTLELMGTQTSGAAPLVWTYYDNFRIEGAELVNGDFEETGDNHHIPGWNCVLDRNFQTVEPGQAGVVHAPALAASGTHLARTSHDHRVTQTLKISQGRKVTVRFDARGTLPRP